MRQHNATFANFICRFGDEKVLLDYAEEIVIPAFTRDTFVRSYGKRTNYHFYDVELVGLSADREHPILALAGRFIKDTELTRHQIFDAKRGLIQDERRMRSSPSAFFVLLLNNHRLIYLPETPHAPDLNAFKATAEQFLRRRHNEYVDQLYAALKAEGEKVTKKSLFETHPAPKLEVIALTGADDIAEFVRRYSILKRIDFRIVRPNDDIDAGEILDQVREFSRGLNAERTDLTTANINGLDIEASIEAVTAATETGNQEVKLTGVDENGNDLAGNNDEFQITAPVENIPPTPVGLARRLYEIYETMTQNGAIRAPGMDHAIEKIRQLVRLL
ncbi:MAG: hypothetical protein H6883_11390 [Rhodobiaceae bacterium]|nr:hypothetical protein [Rhodobiaceae bacterium]